MPYDFTHMRRQKKKQMSKQGKTNKQTNKQTKTLIDTVNNWWLQEARGARAEEVDIW